MSDFLERNCEYPLNIESTHTPLSTFILASGTNVPLSPHTSVCCQCRFLGAVSTCHPLQSSVRCRYRQMSPTLDAFDNRYRKFPSCNSDGTVGVYCSRNAVLDVRPINQDIGSSRIQLQHAIWKEFAKPCHDARKDIFMLYRYRTESIKW